MDGSPAILTVGHSTQPLKVFLEILTSHRVRIVADVRTVPRSRHNPQFNLETLPGALQKIGIEYAHMTGLGGWRRPLPQSLNIGLRSEGFRGYADYMQTEPFERHLDTLIELARKGRVCLMCAEAVPWRCHRSLIADALAVRGIDVIHLLGKGQVRPHRLTPGALVSGLTLAYPGEPEKGSAKQPGLFGKEGR
jgi:uncharacterized protein (DUF488 family)